MATFLMKVVVSDFFPESVIESLREAGLECYYDYTLKGADLRALLQEEQPQALLVKSTRLPSDIISAAPSLELIVRAGTGTDGIDLREASKRGIFVAHCPGKSAMAVAELVLGLMLAADRCIPENVIGLRNGRWDKGRQAEGLNRKTLGIVGLGDIGVEVAKRALAFGMRIVGCDPMLTRSQVEDLGVEFRGSLEEMCPEADIITFHVPIVQQTKHMLTPAMLAACKADALIVNTSRWDIVSEDDMLAALEAHPEMRYACDCYRFEPDHSCEFSSKLVSHPRVYGTCHISSFTKDAEVSFHEEAMRILLSYFRTKTVTARNCSNRSRKLPATFTLEVRMMNEPGILATVASLIAGEGWQILEIESTVFREAKAGRARIDFLPTDMPRVEVLLECIRKTQGVMSADSFPTAREEDESESSTSA